MRELKPMSKERQIVANVYHFTDTGMVVVLDQEGEQTLSLQGPKDEVFPLIEAAGFPAGRIAVGGWWLEELLRAWGRI
jgi:hypothetical protein